MEEKITIQKENVLSAYKQASEEQKALLENMFGKDMFKPKDIMERVKTFEDACEELGEDHQYVLAYREWIRIYYAYCKDVSAYLKLRIICAALNDGWKPTFSDDEYRFYPWFDIYTENEYEKLNEKKKSRFVFAHTYYASSGTGSSRCSMLALKTRELAKYCGKQFTDIWADYLFA